MKGSVTRKLLIAEAGRRGWRVETIGANNHFCKIILPDGRWEMFRGSRPMKSAANGLILAKFKNLTMDFVESLGYKVPPYLLPENPNEAHDFLKAYAPIVVKPLDGQRSEGVSVNIRTIEELEKAIVVATSLSKSNKIILQQQLEGKLYRLLTVNGKLVAAAQRKSAEVTGDGQHTVEELVELLNTDPRRGKGLDTPLKTISLHDVRESLGAKTFGTILSPGQVLRVSAIDSVSAGGEAINVTDMVHPGWAEITTHIAEEAGLYVCGYDIICDDISSPPHDVMLPILELNSSPGLKLHQYPTAGGEPVEVVPILLDELFGK